jgi:CrcB protein
MSETDESAAKGGPKTEAQGDAETRTEAGPEVNTGPQAGAGRKVATGPQAETEPQTDPEPPTRSLDQLKPVLLVAVGGFAGAVLRHAVAVALPDGFPWGTLTVNVAGSFALGILLFEAKLAGRLSAETRLVLGTGFLSSFTTYSTFAVQTAALSPMLAVANVGANYALGFAAVLAGRATVRSLVGREVAE